MKNRIVIIGGGFGGLACAKELGNTGHVVTVVDRRNHNLFQPLLYQVATAALSPADIAEPIRKTLGRYHNINMLMAEVIDIDTETRRVLLDKGDGVEYDRLVIATGSDYNYFGRDEWRIFAPGMKTLHEARLVRQRLLLAFEDAERETDRDRHQDLLTFVVIGGGPTGVEMAGAVSELGRFMIDRDFRNLRSERFRVVLIEAGPKLLAAFPEHLSSYALTYLVGIGVEVRLGEPVLDVTATGVQLQSEFIKCSCVVWGAGVKPSPASEWLGLTRGAPQRIPVDGNLRAIGFDDIFVLGDTALAIGADGKPLPGLAQVAKQQGIYLGRFLNGATRSPGAFRFKNRGNTAVIGRNAAVFDFGSWTLKGRLAWLLWALVHVYLLVNFEKRLLVSIQWITRYLTRQRGARIIDEHQVELGKDGVGSASKENLPRQLASGQGRS
ncbi:MULTISPECIES: NAD(P)/FAD-dependent oxidoreductase [unclassified Rhizobium]|jgi:NADH dehydrogenase|uniref:NAD(P)/FAD-dependent oxidoreductase n=1 Tax=Rhizobium sp. Rhizsp82 TaxID=3243057 RepID=UPI000DD8D58D